jgi:DNA primase
MSLPPGFLDELRARVPLSRIVGRKVTWDNRKSNAGRGDWWAPCPFHQERTASFHVDDRKGFFHCFGCNVSGDAIGFLKDAENLSFIEAVEALATEAGLPMPAQDPKARAADSRRTSLAEVMEQAVQFCRLQLKTNAAAAARAYLDRRGLDAATLDRFEIGFAPPSSRAMTEHLRARGVPMDMIVDAGLAAVPDDGGAPYDRFRDRIMFPIRDPRGRAIAFGGRAMQKDARSKYLNSSETALFAKGRTLYHHGPARDASRKTGRLIVAEGYMDVIALAQAGFDDAVAPLGTAITEDQLRLIWAICPEPVVALDGDRAGIDAALRLADLALPMLEPGRSLRFCLMPENQDPDEVIRSAGAEAMAGLIARARPMADLLWQRETEGKDFDSPERRAALDASLRKLLARIDDDTLRAHYRADLRDRRNALFAPARQQVRQAAAGPEPGMGPAPAARRPPLRATRQAGRSGPRRPFAPDPLPTAETRASPLARGPADRSILDRPRESLILAICISRPALAREFESQIESLAFSCRDLELIRDSLLPAAHDSLHATQPDAFRSELSGRLGFDPLNKLAEVPLVRMNPALDATMPDPDAARILALELARHMANAGLDQELREARAELMGLADEAVTWRLAEAGAACTRAVRPQQADDSDAADDLELSRKLQEKIDSGAWRRKKT